MSVVDVDDAQASIRMHVGSWIAVNQQIHQRRQRVELRYVKIAAINYFSLFLTAAWGFHFDSWIAAVVGGLLFGEIVAILRKARSYSSNEVRVLELTEEGKKHCAQACSALQQYVLTHYGVDMPSYVFGNDPYAHYFIGTPFIADVDGTKRKVYLNYSASKDILLLNAWTDTEMPRIR